MQTKAILASVPPRDSTGKTRRRLAAGQLAELVVVVRKISTLTKQLKVMVIARRPTLMDLPGVGPVVSARKLAEVRHVARFADRNRFASWTGTTPIEPYVRGHCDEESCRQHQRAFGFRPPGPPRRVPGVARG